MGMCISGVGLWLVFARFPPRLVVVATLGAEVCRPCVCNHFPSPQDWWLPLSKPCPRCSFTVSDLRQSGAWRLLPDFGNHIWLQPQAFATCDLCRHQPRCHHAVVIFIASVVCCRPHPRPRLQSISLLFVIVSRHVPFCIVQSCVGAVVGGASSADAVLIFVTSASSPSASHVRLREDGSTVAQLEFGCTIVDPPRAGLDALTREAVSGYDHLLYVSCNPEAPPSTKGPSCSAQAERDSRTRAHVCVTVSLLSDSRPTRLVRTAPKEHASCMWAAREQSRIGPVIKVKR